MQAFICTEVVPKIAKERMEQSQLQIQQAALELFTTKGFHGANIREIANKMGVSTGRIYTYYPSKEAIFKDLAHKYRIREDDWLRQTVRELKNPFSRSGLTTFASRIQSQVRDTPEYLLLIFIDVIEFKNRHFAQTFTNVPERFRRLLGPALNRVKKQPGWRGSDPAFVLASVYLYFFTYFVTEKFTLGRSYLGVSDEEAMEGFIDLLFHGLWRSGAETREFPNGKTKGDREEQRALLEKAREQVGLIRLLSGRLLSPVMEHSLNGAGGKSETRQERKPILFEPRITSEGIDENRLRIEAAALELFTAQGYHGTNLLEIGQKAGVSAGAIYTYYPSKEAMFESLVHSYRSCLQRFRYNIFNSLRSPFSREEVTFLAAAMESLVYDDAEYYLLMFVDILEFGSRNFADAYHDLPAQFRRRLGPILDNVKKQPGWCGQDPAFVLAVLYTCFFSHFHMDSLMLRRHMGVSNEQAIEQWIDMLFFGLWDMEPTGSTAAAINGASRKKPRLIHSSGKLPFSSLL